MRNAYDEEHDDPSWLHDDDDDDVSTVLLQPDDPWCLYSYPCTVQPTTGDPGACSSNDLYASMTKARFKVQFSSQ